MPYARNYFFGNNKVILTALTAKEFLAVESPIVTSVHVFPVLTDDCYFTVNPRGIDIISGHVEEGETYEQALLREAHEEAYINLDNYFILGAIKVENSHNSKYPPVAYQLFYYSDSFTILPFKSEYETTGRLLGKRDNFPSTIHKWLKCHDYIYNLINR